MSKSTPELVKRFSRWILPVAMLGLLGVTTISLGVNSQDVFVQKKLGLSPTRLNRQETELLLTEAAVQGDYGAAQDILKLSPVTDQLSPTLLLKTAPKQYLQIIIDSIKKRTPSIQASRPIQELALWITRRIE